MLRQLEPVTHPDLLVGTNTCDDAGVFRLRDDFALVQTTDFFPPLVDDPFAFGRIAAANALSDIYAMGAEPLTALNLVGYPDKVLPLEPLVDILRGGADACREAGCVIVGGHSVRDNEIKYGLAATGRVHPQRILRNCTARPGDVLVLTKSLGTGVLVSAHKAARITDADFEPAVLSMMALNRPGRDAALATGLADAAVSGSGADGVHAGTDVTGYGLIGHAFEVAQGSEVTIAISAGTVPLLPRTLELARAGVTTRASKTARAYLGARLEIDSAVEEPLADILANAETSGGLLLAVSPGRAAALVAELERAGALCAAVIGQVRAADPRGVRIHITP